MRNKWSKEKIIEEIQKIGEKDPEKLILSNIKSALGIVPVYNISSVVDSI